jgi:transcription elongation GreA/GreB family factor
LVAELDNLVKVQVPENNKAIEIARGFGDFRENAEYDAAKERRRFLQRRRSELETLIATVQPINFLEFKADTSKISMGTEVVLQDASGVEKVYSIVGSSDGDPDRNLVSYKTKIGETLLGAKVGDSLTLPDGSKVTVKSIAPLKADLAKELSPEE